MSEEALKAEEPLYLRYDRSENSLVVYVRNSCALQQRRNLHTLLRDDLSRRRFIRGDTVHEYSNLWWQDQVRTTLKFSGLAGDMPSDLAELKKQRVLDTLRTDFRCRYVAEGTASIRTTQDSQGEPTSHTVTIRHCGHPGMAVGQTQLWLLGDQEYTLDNGGILSFIVPGQATMNALCRLTLQGAKALGVFLIDPPTLTHDYS